ncbi:hypothetical protein [Rubrimonas cliftonensis]|uniref:Uncharacterized protein n=1 Tax=Rubrimonas cliftonensis TaxID=89524 RepID=A0A1H4DJN2_9RHOB|nr:hypothetical protein [Rubrimonas cliftonensis]SEA72756.1 hypothetical protein SAMN05444370_11067 [Rubrimonas cliftonensis]
MDDRGHELERGTAAAWRGSRSAMRGGAWSEAAIRADPLGFVALRERSLRGLADMLERIADGLPHLACPSATALAATRLRMIARQGASRWPLAAPIAAEEELYTLAGASPGVGDMEAQAALQVVRFARREGSMVCGMAAELADALDTFLDAGHAAEPEALGFGLRACFEAIRRRVDWVEDAIMPLARRRLDPEAATAMGARLAAGVAAAPLSTRADLLVIDGARVRA